MSRIYTISILIILASCGIDVEDPSSPGTPRWVKKSLPEAWPERGIDAFELGGIYLEWVSNIEDEVDMYHLFRSSISEIDASSLAFEIIASIPANDNDTLSYIDRAASEGYTHYYKLIAEDFSGNQSASSDSIYYELVQRLPSASLSPNNYAVLNIERNLSWRYYYSIQMEYYIITLLQEDGKFIFRQVFQPSNYTGALESWKIPTQVQLVEGEIYKWRLDTISKIEESRETAGSESKWATFTY